MPCRSSLRSQPTSAQCLVRSRAGYIALCIKHHIKWTLHVNNWTNKVLLPKKNTSHKWLRPSSWRYITAFQVFANNHSLLNSWRPNELLTSSWWVIWTSVWAQVSGVGLCMVHVRVFPTRNMAWPDRSLLHGLAFSNWCSDKRASPSWSLSTKQGLHECSKMFYCAKTNHQVVDWSPKIYLIRNIPIDQGLCLTVSVLLPVSNVDWLVFDSRVSFPEKFPLQLHLCLVSFQIAIVSGGNFTAPARLFAFYNPK